MLTVAEIRRRCTVDEDGCWIWQPFAQDGRHPVVGCGGRKVYVRAWLLRDTPRKYASDRTGSTCNKPLCCNPKHLVWVRRSWQRSIPCRLRMAAVMARRPGCLSLEIARRIRAEGPSTLAEQEACAKRYGVTRRTIFNIVTHRVWRDPALLTVIPI